MLEPAENFEDMDSGLSRLPRAPARGGPIQWSHGALIAAVVSGFVTTAGCGPLGGSETSRAAAAAQQWEMLDRYCVDCHNSAEFTAGIAFDSMSPARIAEEAETFETVLRKLRGRQMPPPDQPQPDEASLYSFVSWLETELDGAIGSELSEQHIVLHRLNRKEYANAVRDLLALSIDSGALLPQDDKRDGLDNVADALQVSPSFIEQYISAARTVAHLAVGRADARPGSRTYEAEPGSQRGHVDGLPLGTRGGILAVHDFPADGEYEISIADMAQALWVDDMEFENTVIVTLDDERLYRTVIGGEEDMKAIDQRQDPAVDEINARLKNIRFAAKAGPHRVGVTFVRRTAAESDDRLQSFLPGGGQDHLLEIDSFQISGPYSPTGIAATPSRERVFSCYPQSEDEALPCAEQIVVKLGTKAFRRPLEEIDIGRLLAYYRDGRATGGFEEGIRSAITGLLVSPAFLYRVERVPQNLTAGAPYRLDDIALASKLSFFLWNSVPDETLLSLAQLGELSDPSVLRAQVERMLADPRSETLASNFAFQWLHLSRLEEVQPDRAIFPYASGKGDPRDDFVTELTLFVDSIFRENRSVIDLLTADHTYLNERIALLYGINDVKGDRYRRVELEDSVRWGLLGKGAVLMATSYPNRTSPVLRGAFVLEHILGTPPAPPPPNVEAFPENDVGTPKARSVREIMAAHRANPACFSCHSAMDPLGFALENFNAVGAWRDRDRFAGTSIDASAMLPDGTSLDGPDDLRSALRRRSDQFVQTLTERLLAYALGRTVEYYDMPSVRKIVREAGRDDYQFSSLVWAVVNSDPFQLRRAANESVVDEFASEGGDTPL